MLSDSPGGMGAVAGCTPSSSQDGEVGQIMRHGETQAEAGEFWGVGQGPQAPPEQGEAVSRPSPAEGVSRWSPAEGVSWWSPAGVGSANPRGTLTHPEL